MIMQNRPARFVIMCQPRTGSYLLVDLLNQFSDIVCHGEIFKPPRLEMLQWAKKRIPFTAEERDKYPITFVRSVLDLTPNRVAGFKMFATHNAFARQFILEDPGIRKVILSRSPLESYISYKRANLTGEWVGRKRNSLVAEAKGAGPKVRFERAEFMHHVKRAETLHSEYAEIEAFTKQEFLRISYDDVVKIEPVRRLAGVLGSKDLSASLAPTLRKQIVEPLEDIVENHEEMVKCLGGDYKSTLVRASENISGG